MPSVSINPLDSKISISPLLSRALDETIGKVAGVTMVLSSIDGPIYSADVTGGQPAAIDQTLRQYLDSNGHKDWQLSVA